MVTPLSRTAVCILYTDGIQDLSRQDEGEEASGISAQTLNGLRAPLVTAAREDGSIFAAPYRVIKACEECGYANYRDDMTAIMFGACYVPEGIYNATVDLSPDMVDLAAQAAGEWSRAQGWSDEVVERIQLVIEEKLMNIYDHGFDERERIRETVALRIKRRCDCAELTVWDCGTPEPSLEVAAGHAETAFDLANFAMRDHGRGRLMVRSMCRCIARNRIGVLNETIYYIPLDGQAEGFEPEESK